jgi:AcrR family transcriptional regulator
MSRPAKHKVPLQRAALEMFSSLGLSAVSVRDIARKTGMAEGTLYRHFPSKEALAISLYEERLKAFNHTLKDLQNTSPDIESFVSSLVVLLVEAYQQDAASFFYVMMPAADFLPVLDHLRPYPQESVAHLLAPLLAKRHGQDERPAAVIAAQLLGSVLFVIQQHQRQLLDGQMTDYIDGLVQAALRVVRA